MNKSKAKWKNELCNLFWIKFEKEPITHIQPLLYSPCFILPSLHLSFILFLLISPSSSSQLRFLDRAPGCGLKEEKEANRLRKTALARPITSRQSTLHVIVLGIHAWLTEWFLMRLGNNVQERMKHSPGFPDWLIHPYAHTGQQAQVWKHTCRCMVTAMWDHFVC